MVKVKMFGLFRLDTGIKDFETEAKTAKEIYVEILKMAKETKPYLQLTLKDLEGCIVSVNGKQVKSTTPLNDGDVVMLTTPVCGG